MTDTPPPPTTTTTHHHHHHHPSHPPQQVEKLSALLGVVGTEYTCETAGYFWLLHVLSR
jgi:hypothetical protein